MYTMVRVRLCCRRFKSFTGIRFLVFVVESSFNITRRLLMIRLPAKDPAGDWVEQLHFPGKGNSSFGRYSPNLMGVCPNLCTKPNTPYLNHTPLLLRLSLGDGHSGLVRQGRGCAKLHRRRGVDIGRCPPSNPKSQTPLRRPSCKASKLTQLSLGPLDCTLDLKQSE